MNELASMEQLSELVRSGFADWRSLGDVYAKYRDGLVLFNYSPEAQYAGRWNWFETVSRGLILDVETGEIVARPFDKFFNWGEGERMTDSPLVHVAEKMDGSLGIAYWHKGQCCVATRGSFDSEQAQWATDWLRAKAEDLHDLHVVDALYGTMLFEIIYPDNRVVVDYEGRAELVLLAIRDRRTGDYMDWDAVYRIAQKYGFGHPFCWRTSDLDYVIELCKRLDANHEGFVCTFADGQRFKFKGDAYKELHKLICGLSFRNTLDALATGKVDDVRAAIPNEFLNQFNEWVQKIQEKYEDVYAKVDDAYKIAPKGNRKEFALWANEFAPDLSPYLFAKHDGRDFGALIYKREFQVAP